MGGMVTIFDPQGNKGEIPYEQLSAAVKAGAKPGVTIKAPDGTLGDVPADKSLAAVKAGGQIVPLQQQENQHPGAWAAIADDLKGLLHPSGFSPYPGMDVEAKQAALSQGQSDNQARIAEGQSLPTRVLNAAGQGAGVNERGMAQSAKEGDVWGVVGHAVAPLIPLAAGAAVKEAAPAVDRAIQKAGPEVAERTYQSALKPSTTNTPAENTAIVKTLVNNKLPTQPEAVTKLNGLIGDLHDAVMDEIQGKGKTVDPNRVAGAVSDTKKQYAQQVNRGQDLNSIDASKQQFLAEQGAKPGTPAKPPSPTGLLDEYGKPIMSGGEPAKPATPAPPMSAEQAQAMKQGTYKVLSDKAYNGEVQSATVAAQKALAHGLMDELETQFPEIKQLNATQKQLIDVRGALERAVNRVQNRDPFSLGAKVATGAGSVVGGAVGGVPGAGGGAAAAAVLHHVLTDPVVRTKLAILLNSATKATNAAKQGANIARIAAYTTAINRFAGAPSDSQAQSNP